MSTPEQDRTVEQRIARLERLVEELRAELAAGRAAGGVHGGEAGRPGAADRTAGDDRAAVSAGGPRGRTGAGGWTAPGHGAPSTGPGEAADPHGRPSPDAPSLAAFGEHWLGRVGVGFVILAFGFLFKYALDQGWLGPAARLSLGFAAGVVMLLVGLRLEGTRERYSQYLLGGAVALFYLVGFAAYQLYEVVPFPFAFAFMAATTVLAFVLAERQRLPWLAVIGASGGLATPFLLYTGSGNVPGLTAYTVVLLAGAGTVQFWRGWRSLLLVLGFGGLLVMGVAVAGSTGWEDWVVLAGVLAAWVLFGVAPLLRASLHRTEPDAWPEPPLPSFLGTRASTESLGRFLLRLGCVSAALVAALEIGVLFRFDETAATAMLAAGFVVYALLARTVFETPGARNAAAETAAILLALSVVELMNDWWMVLPLALVGWAMHGARARWDLPGVGVLAHALFALLTLSFASTGVAALGISQIGWTFPLRLSVLLAIGVGFAASFVLRERAARNAYRLVAHLTFLLWLAVELEPLPEGQGLISLAWGVYGAVLMLASFRLRERGLQLVALGTLGVVAGKLLLIDMSQLDVIWRILLFMGFGSAFLGLSYLINRPQAERR